MAHYRCVVTLSLLASTPAFAQGTISTVAGGSGFVDNIPAVQARLNGPYGLAVDPQGNAYTGEGVRIRKVDAVTGIISTVTTAAGGLDLMTFTATGKLLFLAGDDTFEELDPATGVQTTISVETPPSAYIEGLATDSAGNIFITDSYYDKIYRIDATSGALSTFAGIGPVGNTGSPQGDGGPATLAGLVSPYAITVDPFGNVFFAEGSWLRRIDGKTGIITTIAPTGAVAPSGDGGGDGGPYNKAVFLGVSALSTDSNGNLYIGTAQYVRKIDWTTGIVSRVAGSGQRQYGQDGVPALQANLSGINGLMAAEARPPLRMKMGLRMSKDRNRNGGETPSINLIRPTMTNL